MANDANTLVLEYAEWQELVAAAATLDLVHGGYFRARLREIEFYCGPDNAPIGWRSGFTQGTPENARAVVGIAELVQPVVEDAVQVRLRITNWSALGEIAAAKARGEYEDRTEQFVEDENAALRGRPVEWEWLRRQFRKLREQASGSFLERD